MYYIYILAYLLITFSQRISTYIHWVFFTLIFVEIPFSFCCLLSFSSVLAEGTANTWWILLHNDRKSRHRRIKKQRRHERLRWSKPVINRLDRAGRVGLRTHFLLAIGNPCGNFSDTSTLKLLPTKGAIGHAFTVCIYTENQNQVNFYPFVLHEISLLNEFTLGHLHYHLTDLSPQPNSQPDSVFFTDQPVNVALILENELWSSSPLNPISDKTIRVVVFHCCITQGGHSNFRNKFKYIWV